MKKRTGQAVSLLPGIAALCLLAACSLEPFTAPGAAGKTGRVVISIEAPEAAASASSARTLLPEYGEFDYTVKITKNENPTPVFNEPVPGTSITVDLEAGTYTVSVTAEKSGAVLVAQGSGTVTVSLGEESPVTIWMANVASGTGTLEYTVKLPAEITLTGGSLALYPLSSGPAPVNIDLNAGLSGVVSGVKTVSAGYYRIRLLVYGAVGGVVKFAAKTAVLHITDALETRASYTLEPGNFFDIEPYIAGSAMELADALNSIGATARTLFTILITEDFSSAPLDLADPGYSGKTITIRSAPGGDVHEISLASQGSLFTIGSASSEPDIILQDITLKGMAGNNASLVKLDNGTLSMESGAAVTGNENASSNGGGVYVAGGTLTMQDSALVSGNTASNGGGVYVAEGGTLVKSGGVIYGSGEAGTDADGLPLKNTAQIASSAVSKGGIQNRDATADTALHFTTGIDIEWWNYEVYTVGNTTELAAALNSIGASPVTVFTILATGNFSSPPSSLVGAWYGGKTITLRSAPGEVVCQISLASQGSLFTIGAASVEPVVILRDITLNGMTGNNASLVKLDNGTLIMESGAVITGNRSSSGGGVYVAGGSFTMRDDSSVSGNTAYSGSSSYSSYGGGVYVAGGNFTMEDDASVSGNTASSPGSNSTGGYGGGVYVADGNFTMKDSASVSENTASATGRGGGVYVTGTNSNFTMRDSSSVSENTVSSGSLGGGDPGGGGVYKVSGNFIMEDNASVSGNMVSSGGSSSLVSRGGGVYVVGNFVMRDYTSVNGNTASSGGYSSSYGGGVYDDGGFTMEDNASVSGNTASSSNTGSQARAFGGGVYVFSSFTMRDNASVSGNTASASSNASSVSYGGGVYVYTPGTLTKTGDGVIYGSTEMGKDPNGSDLKNTAQTAGAAVYYNASTPKYRETTVGPEQDLSTGNDNNWTDQL
jgi:hypothetical protein